MNIENITSESWQFIPARTEKLSQGIHLWYKDCPYPRRVMNDPNWQPNHFLRVLEALGTVKKYMFALTYLKSIVIPRTLSIKKYEVFLQHLYMVFWWNLNHLFIKDNEFSVPVWEIGKFIECFLINLGLNAEISKNYTQLVMMILEFDNAYRYRLQDIIGETNKELLKNPRKEIVRLLAIYNSREFTKGAPDKINKLKLLRQFLLLPNIKRSFLKTLESIDLEKIKFDDNDRFHVSYWVGYNFEGRTFEERFKSVEKVFKSIPFQKRDNQEIINNFLLGL